MKPAPRINPVLRTLGQAFRRAVPTGLLIWAGVSAARAVEPAGAASPKASTTIPDPVRAGREMAERLRSAGPEKSAHFDGWMTVSRARGTNRFPIQSRIEVTATNWLVRYVAGATPPVDILTTVHTRGFTNIHFGLSGTNSASGPLTSRELFEPFAASDFWRIDLSLDFLSWPGQRQIGNQMRKGRACRILESVNPAPLPGTYFRVESWVDVETDGILKAVAYDSANRPIKQFEVGRFRKVNGQYQLEEMSISRPDSREETRIHFDLSP